MWAAFWDAFQEVGGRRVVVIMLVLAFAVGLLFNRAVHFDKFANVDVIMEGTINMGPWAFAVPTILARITQAGGLMWLVMMIFIGCPQFVVMQEKGWRELIFSKATARWQILLARYTSIVLMYAALVLTTCLPLALRLWFVTGVSPAKVLGATAMFMFSFSALLAVAAASSMVGDSNVSLPIVSAIGGYVLSQFLFDRKALLYDYVTSNLGRQALDWVYYIVPKCNELQSAAANYVQSSMLPSSWPVWTTGLFAIGMLSLSIWGLERKSY
jgi:ABC-type transport system involved in multi-copper enzyme maturation permease subunit